MKVSTKAATILSAGVAALLLTTAAVKADAFTISYENPGVQNSTIVLGPGITLGVETFDGRTLGTGGFSTDYGTSGAITGTYSASTDVVPFDLYGGAGGANQYADAIGGTNGYTLTFTTTTSGVNYFGFWLSALDLGNQLVFKEAGVTVGTYSPSDMLAALGACPETYCGNPNASRLGQDPGEPFAFVNFLDTNGYFDEIDFYESPNVGNYELDNHTVAYCSDPVACETGHVLNVPEPITLSLFGAGLVGAAAMRRRKKASV